MKKTIWLCLVLTVAIPFVLSAQQKQVRLAYRTTHEISASLVLQKSSLNYRFNVGYVFPLIKKMHGYGGITHPTYFAMRDLHRTGFTYGFMLEAPFTKNERWSKAILLEGSYLTGNFFDNNYLSGMSSVTETAKRFHEYRHSVGVHARLSKQVSEKGTFCLFVELGAKLSHVVNEEYAFAYPEYTTANAARFTSKDYWKGSPCLRIGIEMAILDF